MARVLVSPKSVGVTLAEAILALGLAVVVVLMAVGLAITALRANQKGSDQTVASSWAGKIMENFIYALPPSTDSFWSQTTYTSPYQVDTVQLGPTTFTSKLFVAEISGATAGMKMATVNVTWGSGAQGRTGYGQQVTSISRLIYAH